MANLYLPRSRRRTITPSEVSSTITQPVPMINGSISSLSRSQTGRLGVLGTKLSLSNFARTISSGISGRLGHATTSTFSIPSPMPREQENSSDTLVLATVDPASVRIDVASWLRT